MPLIVAVVPSPQPVHTFFPITPFLNKCLSRTSYFLFLNKGTFEMRNAMCIYIYIYIYIYNLFVFTSVRREIN